MGWLERILFWTGLVLMVDGALGLLFFDRIQPFIRGIDFRRVAFVELGMSVICLAVYYALWVNPN